MTQHDLIIREAEYAKERALRAVQDMRSHLDSIERALVHNRSVSACDVGNMGIPLSDIAESAGRLAMLRDISAFNAATNRQARRDGEGT